eukprot:Gb_09870 [translate_table: standard]
MASSSIVLNPVKDDSILSTWSFHGRWDGFCPNSSEAIEIYLSTADCMTPMRVLASDTIQSVKLRIQRFKGFFVKHQMLIYGGRELARNDSLIKDYGVTDGNVLHLVLRLSDLQVVTVKTLSGKKYVFRVEKSRNVQDLKQRISKRESGLSLDEQQLVLKGEHLEDKRLIEDLFLEDDAVIHLLIRKTVKVRTKPIGIDVEVHFVSPDVSDRIAITPCIITGSKSQITGTQRLQLTDVPKDVHNKSIEYCPPKECFFEPVTASLKVKLSPTFCDLINMVQAGLECGWSPKRSSEGCGGVYFMQDTTGTKYIGVFKPTDEEPMAVNNPRGLPVSPNGEGLKRGTRVGEGAYREVAAYILDHPSGGPRPLNSDEPGFAGVPPTMIIQCSHSAFYNGTGLSMSGQQLKMGSLQKFVECDSNCEDMGPSSFSVHEVHKITVLDIRLANADRHGGNILVCKEGELSSIKLVPIDHGYCLPENFEDCTFEWLYWPQARQPYKPETLKYIESLDADKDVELLESNGWTLSPECSRVLHISTMLLKKGSAAGLTPNEIALMMCRESLNKPSVIEDIVEAAEEAILPACSEAAFLKEVSQIIDLHIAKVKSSH